MQSETTNGHEWTRIRRCWKGFVRSIDGPLFGAFFRRERMAISGPSSLVFIAVNSWLNCMVPAKSQFEIVGQASSLTVHGASLPRVSGGKMLPELADKMSAPH